MKETKKKANHIISNVVFNVSNYLYETCQIGKKIMCHCKSGQDCKENIRVGLCNHSGDEILHQGNGFIYVTCADCGEDI